VPENYPIIFDNGALQENIFESQYNFANFQSPLKKRLLVKNNQIYIKEKECP